MANNTTVRGVLSFDDFAFGNFTRADEYNVSFTAFDQPVNVSLISDNTTELDPIVDIIDALTNEIIVSDDDGGDGLNSLIQNFSPQRGVVYKIRVTSYNSLDTSVETPYTLQINSQAGDIIVTPRQSDFGSSQSGSIVTISDVLDFQDYTFPSPSTGSPSSADEYQLGVSVFNVPIQVSLISSTSSYDPLVQIIDARTGVVLAENDDVDFSMNNLNSLIENFLPQEGVDYRIRVTSYGAVTPADPANYTLQVSTTLGEVTLSPRVSNNNSTTTFTNTLGVGELDTPFTRVHDLAKPGSYLFVAPPEAATLNPPRYDNQGFAFAAAASQGNDPLLKPFYRYVDTAFGREGNYLYVAEPEAVSIDANNPNFVKQGIAFYAYYGGQGSNTINFHRFITSSGAYFFAGDGETASILSGLPASPGQIAPNGFTYQGVAFAAGG